MRGVNLGSLSKLKHSWNNHQTFTLLGSFHLMAWPVRPEFLFLYQWKDLVSVSQISSRKLTSFRSDRSEARTFSVPFNNLTVLTGLAVLVERALELRMSPVRMCVFHSSHSHSRLTRLKFVYISLTILYNFHTKIHVIYILSTTLYIYIRYTVKPGSH
jgi:hypothetical protein